MLTVLLVSTTTTSRVGSFVNIDDSDDFETVDNHSGKGEAYSDAHSVSNKIEVMSLEGSSGSFGEADSQFFKYTNRWSLWREIR